MDDDGQGDVGTSDVPLIPAWAVPGVGRPSPLLDALAEIRSGLEAARAASAVLSDADCRDGVRELDHVMSEVESFWLELVADLDRRPAAIPGVRAGTTAVAFLTAGLNRTALQARRDVAAAKALTAPTGIGTGGEAGSAPLALVGAAFAAGEISREHVDVAVRCLGGLSRRVLDAVDENGLSGWARIDEFLAPHSRTFDPAQVARLAKELQQVLDQDEKDRFDPESFLRRRLSLHDAPDGMTIGRLQLDPASAVWVRTALEHFAARERANGKAQHSEGSNAGQVQGELPIRDERSKGQLFVDGLITMCRLAMGADESRTRREPPHVLVITSPEQLAEAHARSAEESASGGAAGGGAGGAASGGSGWPGPAAGMAEAAHVGPLSPATLARLSCDAILQAVVLDSRTGAVLHLGRTQRTASLAQRKALAARDRGCIIPGCQAPPGRCDAHHVPPWSAGGQTDIDALALLCEAHHTQVHLGVWRIVIVDGVPHIEPPPWHRLAGSGPVRNRLHDAVDRARKLAQQMRLDLGQADEAA